MDSVQGDFPSPDKAPHLLQVALTDVVQEENFIRETHAAIGQQPPPPLSGAVASIAGSSAGHPGGWGGLSLWGPYFSRYEWEVCQPDQIGVQALWLDRTSIPAYIGLAGLYKAAQSCLQARGAETELLPPSRSTGSCLVAHLSAHLLLCPAKGVRSFLATTPCPQLDLEGAL